MTDLILLILVVAAWAGAVVAIHHPKLGDLPYPPGRVIAKGLTAIVPLSVFLAFALPVAYDISTEPGGWFHHYDDAEMANIGLSPAEISQLKADDLICVQIWRETHPIWKW